MREFGLKELGMLICTEANKRKTPENVRLSASIRERETEENIKV
jgi:hypothetical protein